MLTQMDLESLAKQARYRGLHSSWAELVDFSRSVVGTLVDIYQGLLRDSSAASSTSGSSDHLSTVLKEKLKRVLISLTSEEQVVTWEAEVMAAVTGNRQPA